MRELERQMEEAGALLQEDASAAGSGSAASVVSRAQQSQVAQVVGESLVVGGAGRGRGAGGEAPALGGELQDRVDRLRAMVAELERGTLPQLLDARSELLDTAAAMDVRMLRVAEQSAWEAMAAARWDGADVTNQERRQRLRFTGGGVLAFASGEAGGRGKRGRRRRERAKGPFRARVVGAAGVPPTDEEADDELAEKLAADPSGEMMGGPASTFAGGLTSRSASTAAARRADDSGGGATTARSAYMESGQRWEAPDDDGMSSDDSASSDDDPAARGGGATARAGAAKRRAAKDARDAAAMETTGVRRRHVWQLFLPSGETRQPRRARASARAQRCRAATSLPPRGRNLSPPVAVSCCRIAPAPADAETTPSFSPAVRGLGRFARLSQTWTGAWPWLRLHSASGSASGCLCRATEGSFASKTGSK